MSQSFELLIFSKGIWGNVHYVPKINLIWRYRVNQNLIVLKLYSALIIKILVTELLTVLVSPNLNLMFDVKYVNTGKSTTYSRYMFSKVIKCLEKNIRK